MEKEQQIVNCFSIISTPSGEQVFDHIICNDAGGIPIEGDFFPVNPSILGKYETVKITTRYGVKTALKSIDLNAGRIGFIPKTMSWEVEIDNDGVIETDTFTKPITTLVLLKGPRIFNANRTNLRCPMPTSYWEKMVKIERSGAEDIRDQKDAIRKEYAFDFNIENDGVKRIMPDSERRDCNSYLIALAEEAQIEWVLSRRSFLPNTFRIECLDGNISLINPRTEVSLMAK